MKHKDVILKVSNELNIPEEVIKEAYYAYWKFVRNTIKELPLKDGMSKEEFDKLKVNFNIPSLGKLYCNYDRMMVLVNKYKKEQKKNDKN